MPDALSLHPVMRVVFAAFVLALGSTIVRPDQSGAERPLTRDFPVLASRLSTGVRADFVVVIDRSASMRRFWPEIRAGLVDFIDALPDGDYVSIIAFGTKSSSLVTPRPISADTRLGLNSELAGLPDPADANTDIGSALEKTLEELARPDANTVRFVFLFTDFAHDPPGESAYPRDAGPTSVPWRQLAERRTRQLGDAAIEAYALLLPAGPDVGRDIALGRAVFPGLRTETLGPGTLGPWFVRKKAERERDVLKAVVSRDIEGAAPRLVEVVQRDDVLVARLAAPATEVVDVAQIRDAAVSEFRSRTLETLLTPIPSAPVTVAIDQPEAVVEVPIARITGTSLFVTTVTGDLGFSVRATSSFGPAGEIEKLDLVGATDRAYPYEIAAVSIRHGRIPVWTAVLALAVLLLTAVSVARRMRPEYIVGQVIVIGVGAPLTLRRPNRRTVLKVGAVGPEEGISVPGAKWVLVLQAFKPPQRPRGVYVRMASGQAEIDGGRAVTDQIWEPIRRGVSITVGGRVLKFD